MTPETESKIRQLSSLFAKQIEIIDSTPFKDISPEQEQQSQADALELEELIEDIAYELDTFKGGRFTVASIINITRNEGSDAAEPLAHHLDLLTAFQKNIQEICNEKGLGDMNELSQEAWDKTKQQFDNTLSGP